MKINMHTSHPSAFISSTFVDLFDDRRAVADSLKKMRAEGQVFHFALFYFLQAATIRLTDE
jgi:hypothetical protein